MSFEEYIKFSESYRVRRLSDPGVKKKKKKKKNPTLHYIRLIINILMVPSYHPVF